jgi:hypothetical protein
MIAEPMKRGLSKPLLSDLPTLRPVEAATDVIEVAVP